MLRFEEAFFTKSYLNLTIVMKVGV